MAKRQAASTTKLYGVWCNMRRRCRPDGHPRYGRRGIRVCARWEQSFEAFAADVGERPSAKHSLERIDNDGDYEPGNVRWATHWEQMANTRKNRKITYQGLTLHIHEWSRRTGVPVGTITHRLERGWDLERVFSLDPVWNNEAQITVNGITDSLSGWQRRTGIDHATIRNRIQRGLTPEQAVSLPVKSKPKAVFIEYGGERLSVQEWSNRTGIAPTTIHYRLSKGMSPGEVLTTPVRGSDEWRKVVQR